MPRVHLADAGPTPPDVVTGTCLPGLLWEQALARPGATAVVDGERSLTYRELAQRSSDLAAYLRHLGVAPDDCVGLFVEPSIDLMVGAWGILLAGGAYLPLSAEYPQERLRYMIGDCRTSVILTQPSLAARLAELAPPATRVVTPQDAAAFTETAGGEPHGGPRADDLAYVIYTSGSTGKPKGVMIEHRSIVSQMRWLRSAYDLGPDSTVLQKTPMSFDAAQWEILAVTCGSRVVMGAPGVSRDPDRLIDTVMRHGVTTLQCVPTLLQALLDTDELHRCTSLRRIFSGGEALSTSLARRCLDALPGCELVNLYGPTECTINSSGFTVDRSALSDAPGTVSIGTPAHGTRYYILDERRMPVATGEVGELHIGGVQLARGYLHRPDLTADRFIPNPLPTASRHARLYRTGDLASRNPDGTVQFAGRTDNQVKLRGCRVELDEIKLAIETHDWVRQAAVIVSSDPRTGSQSLVAFIELHPEEAALMDQGNHGEHHRSKDSRLQIRAQLSDPGLRDGADLDGRVAVDLPGSEPTEQQRRRVFARKTYRYFEGGDVTRADILALLGRRRAAGRPRGDAALSLAELGEILRSFGQFRSAERLLPKYGYASPGSLYATQLYVELGAVGGLTPGTYYYHPVEHRLVLIRAGAAGAGAQVKVHLVGKRSAIEPVYTTNIREVLELEAGHMVGLFEEILPAHGLAIAEREPVPATKDELRCAADDLYLGTFEIVPCGAAPPSEPPVEFYVQAHPGRVAGLPGGHYHYDGADLVRISDDLILQKHVIAINQQVYRRASVGITAMSAGRRGPLSYVDLGRALQRLQSNDLGLGFMSAGYSSETGRDLPAARRLRSILAAAGREAGPSYFFVGGRVSDEQRRSEGMKEDAVHMQGPTEMIRDDLVTVLPDYMMPARVVVLDRLPLTANGKLDATALRALDEAGADRAQRPFVAPRTATERRIGAIWQRQMKHDAVSVHDDFFAAGGNSLIAVGLIHKINRACASALPLQVLFEAPTIEQLALRIDGAGAEPSSRLVGLATDGSRAPVYCWPGLGGSTMNLRLLAGRLDIDRPFYGVQAHGINAGEVPYPTLREMAERDIELIRRLQPEGPYTLWGYSFGARMAFEAACQLEQAGERVQDVFLIAPGAPKVRAHDESRYGREPTYANKAFVTILCSVFTGAVTGPVVEECLRVATDEERFAAFISERVPALDAELVRRISLVVEHTYLMRYADSAFAERLISAPITVFEARGDAAAFIAGSAAYASRPPAVIELDADHYGLLRDPGVGELVTHIRDRVAAGAVAR